MKNFFDVEMAKLIHLAEKLANVNDEIHYAFKYHPTTDEVFNDIAGQTFKVLSVGYGNDVKIVALKYNSPLN